MNKMQAVINFRVLIKMPSFTNFHNQQLLIPRTISMTLTLNNIIKIYHQDLKIKILIMKKIINK